MDYYKILGVSPTARFEEIRTEYRKLARQYHPDLNPGNQYAEETFKLINIAYEILKDPVRRKNYDILRAYGFYPKNIWARNPEEIELEELLILVRKQFDEFVNSVFENIRQFIRSLNPIKSLRKILFGE